MGCVPLHAVTPGVSNTHAMLVSLYCCAIVSRSNSWEERHILAHGFGGLKSIMVEDSQSMSAGMRGSWLSSAGQETKRSKKLEPEVGVDFKARSL